jgi:hypothetical protein
MACSKSNSRNSPPCGRKSKFSEEQLIFLTSQETLVAWSSMPLKQRAIMFHRRFPSRKISSSSLQRLYSAHGIKLKKIKLLKPMSS